MAIIGILWAIGLSGLLASPDKSPASEAFAVLLVTASVLIPVAILFELGAS